MKVLDNDVSGTESAWSGMALVSPEAVMRERPELVRAIHRELAGPLDELIAWLDRAHNDRAHNDRAHNDRAHRDRAHLEGR